MDETGERRQLPPELCLRVFKKLSAEDQPPVRLASKAYCGLLDGRVAAVSTSIQLKDGLPLKAAAVHELHSLVKFINLIHLEIWNTPPNILQLLPPLPKLKRLSVGHCDFPPDPKSSPKEEFRVWEPARAFLAGSTDLGDLSFSIPVSAGFKGCDALAALPKLKRLGITCEFGDPIYILQSLSRVTGLKSFSLSCNRRSSYCAENLKKSTRFPWMSSLRSLKLQLMISINGEAIACNARLQAAMLRSCSRQLKQFESCHPPVSFLEDAAAVHEKLPQLQYLSVNCCSMEDLLGLPAGGHSLAAAWQHIGRCIRSYTPHSEHDFIELIAARPVHLTALHLLRGLPEKPGEWRLLSHLTGLRELTIRLNDACPANPFPIAPLTNLTRLGWIVSPTATTVPEQRQLAAAVQNLPRLKQLDLKLFSYCENDPGPYSITELGKILAPPVISRSVRVHAAFHIAGIVAPLDALAGLEPALEHVGYFQNYLQFADRIFDQLQPFTQLRALELCGGWQGGRQFADYIGRLSSLTKLSYLRVLDHLRGPGELCPPLDSEALENGCSQLVGLRKLCYHSAEDASAPEFRACCEMHNNGWLPHEW